MSKGLEALERLMKSYYEMCVIDNCNDDMYQKFNNSSERGIIEKELKALEIIKVKLVDIGYLYELMKVFDDTDKILLNYNMICARNHKHGLTKEEYDLLKEVLL